jgi:hypothetical protein
MNFPAAHRVTLPTAFSVFAVAENTFTPTV